jgi:hypothetical protein
MKAVISLPFFRIVVPVILLCATVFSAGTTGTESKTSKDETYRIDQPGTITFTVGVKISGKVEKPQVMIFLPKEKTLYRDEVLKRSFADEIEQPLPFSPILE